MKKTGENLFKSWVKRKIKFTMETFVKFLITGTIAVSVTACGGGGGGGSSSGSSGSNVVTKYPGVDSIKAEKLFENSNSIFAEDIIKSFGRDYTGLKVAKNSEIIFDANNTIEIKGKDSLTGVLVTGNSNFTNKGTIRIEMPYLGDDGADDEDDNSYLDDKHFADVLVKYMGKGIFVTDNSTGTNEGIIELKGSGAGVLAYGKGSVGINKGTIKLIKPDGSDAPNYNQLQSNGMISGFGGKVINDIDGEIISEVSGNMGMFSYKGELLNKGKITLTGTDVYGMVVQSGKIENGENGKIILSHGSSAGDKTNEAIEVEGGKGINKGLIEIENKYNYSYNNFEGNEGNSPDFDDIADIGMYGAKGAELINEKTGKIKISGSTAGMMIDGEYGEKSSAVNNGEIIIFSKDKPYDNDNLIPTVGMGVEDGGRVENNNLITGNGIYVIGIAGVVEGKFNNAVNTIINNGRIELSGTDLHGIQNLKGKNGNLTNNDTIKLSGSELYGIQGVGKITNNGLVHLTIEETSENGYISIGMDLWEADAVNGQKGKVIIENKIGGFAQGVSIDEDGGTFKNQGLIEVIGGTGAGVSVGEGKFEQKSGSATNEKGGVITVISNNEMGSLYGMVADGKKASVTNKGEINVNGEGTWGMAAFNGAIATNANTGVINVGDSAAGGMYASGEGSVITNNGIINISSSNSTAEGMKVENGGKILNEGIINTDREVQVEASGTYVIGTEKDGDYGKISAKNVKFDGTVLVETDIAKGEYNKNYLLQNVVTADEINMKKDIEVKSDSLLYDASLEKDTFGNLDARLERNGKNISDFTDKKFVEVSTIFDDYINNQDEYNKLSSKEQEVVDTIFDKTSSKNQLRDAIAQVTGTEYLNIQKQIFDIKNSFKKYDKNIISTLDRYNFNVQFVGEQSETDSKDGILGYENKMTGFTGAVKLSEKLYGVLGYGYSDIDFDGESEGNIQTIHTGIYQDINTTGYNMRIGVYGEYNFHENDRAVFEKRAEAEYNSYLVGVSGEISKKYGENFYVEPIVSLDVAYGNIAGFKEEKAEGYNLEIEEQDYTSILPKVGVNVGKEFNNSRIFASAEYSYELGDMNKDMTIELLNKKADVENNEMENGQFDISVGGSINIKNISLSSEIGKMFGKRDREYIKAGFSYKF